MFGPAPKLSAATDILVTGIGLVTPLGIGRQPSWKNLLNGQRAGRILLEDEIDNFSQLAALLKRPPAGAPVDHQTVTEHLRGCSRLFQTPSEHINFADSWGKDCLNNMVAFCLEEALADSDLVLSELANPRTGCVIGTSKPSLRSIEFESRNPHSFHTNHLADELWTSGFMPDSPLRTIQHLVRASGPSGCPIAACATGLFSVIEGAALIGSGQCDVCIVGSADASLRPSVLAAFHRLGVTSRSTDPEAACRPFDKTRDGFIIGEGAAVIILESRHHAERRHAPSYCEITHGLSLTDPTGITQINNDGDTVTELLNRLNCDHPDFISVHGTGTKSNDQAEACGIARRYGNSPVSSPGCFGIKGAMGHLLGAAASVEFGLTCLSMKHSMMPPTSNFMTLDEAAPICVSADSQSVTAGSKSAIKLSLGFGGHVVGCVVKSID